MLFLKFRARQIYLYETRVAAAAGWSVILDSIAIENVHVLM
jgi:hypothetical protein